MSAECGERACAPARCIADEQTRHYAVLLVAVSFGIGGYLLGLQRAAAGASLADDVTSALSTQDDPPSHCPQRYLTRACRLGAGVLDEHFREMDAKHTGNSSAGFGASSGVNHLELFKWKANVPPVQIVAARRTIAELATSVPSLGHQSLLSGEALAGRQNSADLAVVAHFATVEELEAYERSAERQAAMESIRPLLAEAPTTASFGNDVPTVLAEQSGAGTASLCSGSVGPQVGQGDYDAALEVLAAHEGKPTGKASKNAFPPKRAPPPPPNTNPPSADEADAILEAHFAKTKPTR